MARKKKSDIPEVTVTAPRRGRLEKLSDKYTEFAEKNPGKKLVADFAPFAGTATGVADTLNDAYRGNYANLPLDVVGIIPGGRYLTRAFKAAKEARALGNSIPDAVRNLPREHYMIRANENGARILDNTQDAVQANDNMPKYAKGGSVRGNGIAQRGLTKGRMR